jgi:N-acetylmuramoyl-L-alanine amidase
MRRVALALAAILLAAPSGVRAEPARRPGARATRAAKAPREAARREARTPKAPKARPAARPAPQAAARLSRLEEARAAMKAVMQDRTRRRFRHHWERAIAGLERAARGKDAPAGLLEAARARYALYRWSADEADRERALALAARATRAGSREAPALAAAIRREAGDDRPARPAVATQRPRPGARQAPAPAAADRAAEPEADAGDEESPPDPTLEAAVADLTDGGHPKLAPGESAGAGPATVSEIRTWSSTDYTRVAIYLSHWVGWQKLELAPEGGHPRRLALDLRPATLTGKALERPVAGDRVDRVRAAQNDPQTVRVVLDLPGQDHVQLFSLDDPPRLIVDVGTHEAIRNVAAAEPPHEEHAAPSAPPAPSPAAPGPAGREDRSREGIRRIVVDAGHGGHDPGAIGPQRVREKDVTLAMARRLARRLRAEGFQVVLTRSDDRYLALEERTALANTARGDLFVSIHANAHPRRARSGVETYFLNVADDRYAARLAARENGLDTEDGMGDVARILTDLDAKASADSSRKLAQLVQREVCGGVRARVGEVRDLGVKSALFYVLLGARMPAVLVETAFISNRVEERRLTSSSYQDEVAAGIARAVTTFARGADRLAAIR